MYAAAVELSLDALSTDRGRERVFEALAAALAAANVELLRSRRLPMLYASGVEYIGDDDGGEDPWRDALRVLELGGGDCDDLVPWRLAELWLAGVRASPVAHLEHFADGTSRVHLTVRLPDGRVEDPSRVLGMR